MNVKCRSSCYHSGLTKNLQFLKNGVEDFEMKFAQGAKKIIFIACHSGKLKLAFTSPDVISTIPKTFIDFTVLLIRIPQKRSLAVGQVKNSIH